MKEPVFLNKEQVLQLHKRTLEDYGGSTGIRDEGLLDSAIFQPEASFGGVFLHDSLFLMAAAYYFHISQNQPFMDGNKRTGFLSLFTFLKINGFTFNAPNETIYPFLIEVAEKRKTKDDLAVFIENNSTRTIL